MLKFLSMMIGLLAMNAQAASVYRSAPVFSCSSQHFWFSVQAMPSELSEDKSKPVQWLYVQKDGEKHLLNWAGEFSGFDKSDRGDLYFEFDGLAITIPKTELGKYAPKVYMRVDVAPYKGKTETGRCIGDRRLWE